MFCMFCSLPLPCLTAVVCGPKAPGVGDFFDIIYRYWEGPLREQQTARAAKASSSAAVVVEIDDDDGADLLALETESLRQAMVGIVVEGVIVLDGLEKEGDGRKGEKGEKGPGCEKGGSKVEKPIITDYPGLCHNARKPNITIDHVLNPPGLPRVGPHEHIDPHADLDGRLALLKQLIPFQLILYCMYAATFAHNFQVSFVCCCAC